eukprot:m.293425 g.293425  ORF g.293425 m.293425 type:complete len:65 (+) comp234210_c0_seq1:68-262(+)
MTIIISFVSSRPPLRNLCGNVFSDELVDNLYDAGVDFDHDDDYEIALNGDDEVTYDFARRGQLS